MKRALLIVLLSFGTVAGYASGIHHLRHGGCGWDHGQRWQPPTDCPCHSRSETPPARPQAQPEQPKAPEVPTPGTP